MTEKTTLAIGSNGKTGRRVADRLRERGVTVRPGSRSGTPPFDWADPATWEPVLRGADSAYVTYYPDLAAPGAVEAVGELARRAADAGVRRLVLLSGRGEEAARRSEEAVRDSGAEWTVVRASWFNQNFDEGHLLEPVLGGTVVLPAGEVAEPFVDAGDIADVAVAALTEDGHAGQVYEVTGPRLLTFAEAAAEISGASGREVRYLPVSTDGYAATLVEYGMPAGEAELFAGMFAEILDGRNAFLGDGVQRALGRPPRDFADYAAEAAATGVWKG